ncbi:ead/Ea22-like family protein [Citrobacter sp. Cf093]|uniref:ead/Ea22-like family protein n=1 Tax=Citrobacter sp. Cf093 TaxID=2985056 RepID=UPI002574DA70|nr:ead/Ea22-like family protein [Citrobacter sp. Cf093]MDM3214821.1 ead/Ea22-like family protein [Citrobacter sp. Cf093]
MKALNKQALREAANAANIASWGKWESYKPHKGARGYEVRVGAKAVAQHCLKVDSAFIAAANPATVLALLDDLEAAEKRIAEQNFENRLLANADRDIKALRQRIAELESRTVTLPPRAPENLAACLDGYDKWVIATTFRDTWNACLSEVMRMNAAGIGVKGE